MAKSKPFVSDIENIRKRAQGHRERRDGGRLQH